MTALITEHDVKADVLVSIALIASVATSEFFAVGEVAVIMQIGSLLEDFTADRARKGIEGLIKLIPKTARVKQDGKVKQNIIIGLIINFTTIILSATGLLVPTTAAIVHNCGSVFVVVNAAMLLREKNR